MKKPLFESRQDPEDLRIGDLWTTIKPERPTWGLLGAPDDEGIRLNSGRPGAAEAPDEIRRFLFKTCAGESWQSNRLWDLGDHPPGLNLEDRYKVHRQWAQELCEQKIPWMALGGGHDYAYPHVAGVLQVEPECLVLNFDAHLDCRPLLKGMNSGTPFRRLLEEFPGTSVVEIGVQQALNSPHHWKWLQGKGGQIYPLQFIQERGLNSVLDSLEPENRPLFLSLDMDVFSSAYAPGCSASWPQGMGVKDFFQCLQPLFKKFRVLGMGIYEVSPPLDSDSRTCKLAAQILHSAMGFWRSFT